MYSRIGSRHGDSRLERVQRRLAERMESEEEEQEEDGGRMGRRIIATYLMLVMTLGGRRGRE